MREHHKQSLHHPNQSDLGFLSAESGPGADGRKLRLPCGFLSRPGLGCSVLLPPPLGWQLGCFCFAPQACFTGTTQRLWNRGPLDVPQRLALIISVLLGGTVCCLGWSQLPSLQAVPAGSQLPHSCCCCGQPEGSSFQACERACVAVLAFAGLESTAVRRGPCSPSSRSL